MVMSLSSIPPQVGQTTNVEDEETSSIQSRRYFYWRRSGPAVLDGNFNIVPEEREAEIERPSNINRCIGDECVLSHTSNTNDLV